MLLSNNDSDLKNGNKHLKRMRDLDEAENDNKKTKLNNLPRGEKRSQNEIFSDNLKNTQSVKGAQKNETKNSNKEEKNKTEPPDKKLDLKESLKCEFCSERFLSKSCLFYTKRKPFFKDDVPACDCCSSGEEELDGEDFDEKTNNDLQKVSVNPGWYGKGIRKNVRKKR